MWLASLCALLLASLLTHASTTNTLRSHPSGSFMLILVSICLSIAADPAAAQRWVSPRGGGAGACLVHVRDRVCAIIVSIAFVVVDGVCGRGEGSVVPSGGRVTVASANAIACVSSLYFFFLFSILLLFFDVFFCVVLEFLSFLVHLFLLRHRLQTRKAKCLSRTEVCPLLETNIRIPLV